MKDTGPKALDLQAVRLEDLMSLDAYQAARSQIWPSKHSLSWFVRTHYELLLERRALLKLTGRKMVDPAAFDVAAIEAGYTSMIEDQRGGPRRRIGVTPEPKATDRVLTMTPTKRDQRGVSLTPRKRLPAWFTAK